MKVISGKYRGRNLFALEGRITRPTSARVKEDMFNILSNWFIYDNKISLDLFAGSGALSIEGISRGIKYAYLNDINRSAIEVIKKNLHDISDQIFKIYQWDFKLLLNHMYNNNLRVDIIYLDPPFPHPEYYYEFFDFLKKKNILNEYGVVLVEAPELLDEKRVDYLKLLRYKNLKDKHIYLFRLEE